MVPGNMLEEYFVARFSLGVRSNIPSKLLKCFMTEFKGFRIFRQASLKSYAILADSASKGLRLARNKGGLSNSNSSDVHHTESKPKISLSSAHD